MKPQKSDYDKACGLLERKIRWCFFAIGFMAGAATGFLFFFLKAFAEANR